MTDSCTESVKHFVAPRILSNAGSGEELSSAVLGFAVSLVQGRKARKRFLLVAQAPVRDFASRFNERHSPCPRPNQTMERTQRSRASPRTRVTSRSPTKRSRPPRTTPPRPSTLYDTVDAAAAKLSLDPTALRARLRRAQRAEGRSIIADLGGGITAFKFGSSWRISFPQP